MKNNLKLFVVLFLIDAIAFANPFVVKGGNLKFTAVGKPGFLKISGQSGATYPKGTAKIEKDNLEGDFEFDLKALDTGINLRNEHMKEKYLEVGKFPLAKLSLKSLPIKEAELDGDFKKPFKGTLTLHGETKEIDGEFSYAAKSKQVTAQFSIRVSDYKIDIPKYMGITVSESVEIECLLSF